MVSQITGNREFVNTLNVRAIDRALSNAELESVELRRVVGAGDLNSAGNIEIVLRPVSQRCRNYAYIDNVEATLQQTRNQFRVQSITTRPIVAADCNCALDVLRLKKRCISAGN